MTEELRQWPLIKKRLNVLFTVELALVSEENVFYITFKHYIEIVNCNPQKGLDMLSPTSRKNHGIEPG